MIVILQGLRGGETFGTFSRTGRPFAARMGSTDPVGGAALGMVDRFSAVNKVVTDE